MKHLFFFSCLLLTNYLFAQIQVEDFRRGSEADDVVLSRAMRYIDSVGHGSLEFDGTRNYRVNATVQLPRYRTKGRRIIILNGNGAKVVGAKNVNVFQRLPKNQKETSQMMSTRFVFNDFTFEGGAKAIDLGATYNSSINRCNFVAQTVAAVDIQFGLQTTIKECNATNCAQDNFVLRTGEDWGGNFNNSQSNHSVIERCRVFAGDGANSGYKIIGSGGVAIRDCISEGHGNIKYSIYMDKSKSTTVKLFTVENFHLEHNPSEAGIYINNEGNTTIDGVFYQHAYTNFPLITAARGTQRITVRNVPWYVQGSCLKDEGNAYWRLEYCHRNFYHQSSWIIYRNGQYKRGLPFYFSGKDLMNK